MRIHVLQHVPFEGPAAIHDWAESRGHSLAGTELFRIALGGGEHSRLEHIDRFPVVEDLDFLVIMGGPMGVHDAERFAWLDTEKAFIQAVLDAGKAVFGVCLGAQLIADVLGAAVTQNPHPEIGWFPVRLTEAGRAEPLFAGFPESFSVLHWHGDTFAIPPGAVHLASSEGCPNQAFSLEGGRVVGLQFHLEETPDSLALLVENAGAGLAQHRDEPWVTTNEELLASDAPYGPCRELLFLLLDRMAEGVGA